MLNSLFKKTQAEETAREGDTRTLVVKTSRCPQNHSCPSIKVCPAGALTQKGFSAPVADMDVCIRCGKCVKYCPKGALVLE